MPDSSPLLFAGLLLASQLWSQQGLAESIQPERSSASEGAEEKPDHAASLGAQSQARALPRLVLAGQGGLAFRPLDSDLIHAKPAFAYGVSGEFPIHENFWARAVFHGESHPIEVESGAYLPPGESSQLDFSQSNLQVLGLSLLAEPQLRLGQRWRAISSVGAGWSLLCTEAPQAESIAAPGVRQGHQFEFLFGLGLAYELVPRWLELGLRLEQGLVLFDAGKLFEPLQVLHNGQISHLAGFPHLQGASALSLSLGVKL